MKNHWSPVCSKEHRSLVDEPPCLGLLHQGILWFFKYILFIFCTFLISNLLVFTLFTSLLPFLLLIFQLFLLQLNLLHLQLYFHLLELQLLVLVLTGSLPIIEKTSYLYWWKMFRQGVGRTCYQSRTTHSGQHGLTGHCFNMIQGESCWDDRLHMIHNDTSSNLLIDLPCQLVLVFHRELHFRYCNLSEWIQLLQPNNFIFSKSSTFKNWGRIQYVIVLDHNQAQFCA